MRRRAMRPPTSRGRATALGLGAALVLAAAPGAARASEAGAADRAGGRTAVSGIAPFLGTWTLVPDADLQQRIDAGIDRSLRGMSALTRFAARAAMRARIAPPGRLAITLRDADGAVLRIQTGEDAPTDVDLNAPPRPYPTPDGEPVVRSARLDRGTLTVEWRRSDRSGGRVYEVSESGATLTVQEIIDSERFSVPLRFDARFRRSGSGSQEAVPIDGSRAAPKAAPEPRPEHDRANP